MKADIEIGPYNASDAMNNRPKIFGIGLNKTGTTSLRTAFIALGYNHCARQGRLLGALHKHNFQPLFDVAEQFDTFEDWPWPLFYQTLFEKYQGNVKFVLTRRSTAQKWVDSIKRHSQRTNFRNKSPREQIYGYAYPHGVEDKYMAYYERHNQAVRDFFRENNASDQLVELCWEEGDGWPELCGFLDLPAPFAPFPRENAKGQRKINPEKYAMNRHKISEQLQQVSAVGSLDDYYIETS